MSDSDLVKKLFVDVFQKGNLHIADEILTEDFTFQYPFPEFAPGIEGIKEFTATFHKGFPGFELDINDLFEGISENGTSVAIRWTFRGKHTDDFIGVKSIGNYVSFSAIGVYRGRGTSRGPRLSRGWIEMDVINLLRSIGVIEPISKILPSLRHINGKNP
jgi:predicted ester cyclase